MMILMAGGNLRKTEYYPKAIMNPAYGTYHRLTRQLDEC